MKQFIAFAAAGLAGTAVQYALLAALVERAGVDAVTASLAGFAAGAGVNYVLAHRVVFRSARSHAEALPRFLAVAGSGFIINGLLMGLWVHRFGWPYLPAQLLTTLLLLFWHYGANALWTFRERR